MAVPQLQYAQMPVLQPRSEMAEFSNALLNAGRILTERKAQEQARRAAAEQQAFQNQMAQSQLGIQQEQLGLQKTEAERAAERFGLEKQRFDLEMTAAKRAEAKQQRDAMVAQELSKPEHVQAMQGLDIGGQMDYVKNLSMSMGTFDEEDQKEYYDKKMQYLDSRGKQEVRELQKDNIRLEMQKTKQDMELTKIRADKKGMFDPDAIKIALTNQLKNKDAIQEQIDKARSYSERYKQAAAVLQQSRDFEMAASLMPEGDDQISKDMAALKQMSGKMSDEQKATLQSQISNRLMALAADAESSIPNLKQSYSDSLMKANQLQQMILPGEASIIGDIYSTSRIQPQRPDSFGDQLLGLAGKAVAEAERANRIEAFKAKTAREGVIPGGRTLDAVKGAMQNPLTSKEEPVRTTAPRKPFLEWAQDEITDSYLLNKLRRGLGSELQEVGRFFNPPGPSQARDLYPQGVIKNPPKPW